MQYYSFGGKQAISYHPNGSQVHSFSHLKPPQNAHPAIVAQNQMHYMNKKNTTEYDCQAHHDPHYVPQYQRYSADQVNPHGFGMDLKNHDLELFQRHKFSDEIDYHAKRNHYLASYGLVVPHYSTILPEILHLQEAHHFGPDGHNFGNSYLHSMSLNEFQNDYHLGYEHTVYDNTPITHHAYQQRNTKRYC